MGGSSFPRYSSDMSSPKKKLPSRPIETYGVARALDHIRDAVSAETGQAVAAKLLDELRTWLHAERAQGRLECSEDQIETLARRSATAASAEAYTASGAAARKAAANAIGETWQLAINRSVTDEDHEAVTARMLDTCPACGVPLVPRV